MVGPDMLEENISDPGESTSFLDPGEGTSSRYDSRSHASQWRDRQKILKVVNIYFLPSKLYGSSKSSFLAKNQL